MDGETANVRHIDTLAEQVRAHACKFIVITAGAGMGKSFLLRKLAKTYDVAVCKTPELDGIASGRTFLWDIPFAAKSVAFDEPFFERFERVVIARRPATDVPGIERLIVHGEALSLDDHDLMLPERDPARRYQCGWPVLCGVDLDDPAKRDQLTAYIGFETLRPLTAAQLATLWRMFNGHAIAGSAVALPFLPFVDSTADGAPAACANGDLREIALQAANEEIGRRMERLEEATPLARALHQSGHAEKAISALQYAGMEEPAVRLFAEAGGVFYIHIDGPEAYAHVLSGFSPEISADNETVVIANAMRALKAGETGRAKKLIADRFGRQSLDPMAVFAGGAPYSLSFKGFRLVLLIYEDIVITDAMFERLYDYLDELPLEASLLRGSFYNAVLEFYIRQRRFNEAEMAASQALSSYRAAGVPLLVFYICVHQAVIRLLSGDATGAGNRIAEARQYMAEVGFESPADERILRLIEACHAYEDGRPQVLIAFINNEFDTFSQAETWPSLVEFALHYGSQALSEHFSTLSALGFLDRWRLHQMHDRHLRFMIEIRAALVMQNGNRWSDAATTLSAMQSRINRTWVEAALDELARLSMHDEIEVAFAWLRQIVHERPERAYLDRQISAMISNERVTGRQRRALQIWLAFVLKRTGRATEARAELQRMFDDAARTGTIAPLQEERRFLGELMSDSRIEGFVSTAGPARRIMKRLSETGIKGRTIEQESGLSRREVRILLMICEGASNKFIAGRLGISESTVKFHLTNLYRKLGCTRRREAIAVARARNWLH
ncbi:MAG: helix-turn-helix transcriptional regulator [Rhizobiaceae bacterium]|nr:helix-turn-helix transcriptional regulator [Rhizobiaceae bacterium]